MFYSYDLFFKIINCQSLIFMFKSPDVGCSVISYSLYFTVKRYPVYDQLDATRQPPSHQ